MKETINLGPWPVGINNRQADYAMPTGEDGHVIAVSNAVNVDISVDGRLSRRSGFTKIRGGVGLRGGFSCKSGTYYVKAGNLIRLNDDDSETTIWPNVAGGSCSYHSAGDDVLFTDGNAVLKITGDTVTHVSMPGGSIVRQYNGRIYTVSGKVVWFTEPFELHVNYEHGFLQFVSDITVIEPVSGGMWIVADKHYFLSGGDPLESSLMPSLDCQATSGTSARLPDGTACWQTHKGTVIAGPGEEIKLITEKHLSPDYGRSGAAHYREEDGKRSFIVSISDAQLPALAARSFMTMEVIRREEK